MNARFPSTPLRGDSCWVGWAFASAARARPKFARDPYATAQSSESTSACSSTSSVARACLSGG
jgi:hypothetical protein